MRKYLKPPRIKCCAEFLLPGQSLHGTMLYAHGPQFWRFLGRHSFPCHPRIPSVRSLRGYRSAPWRAQCVVARAPLAIMTHRHPLASGPVPPVRFATACGEQTLQPPGYTAAACEMRHARRVQVAMGRTLGLHCGPRLLRR